MLTKIVCCHARQTDVLLHHAAAEPLSPSDCSPAPRTHPIKQRRNIQVSNDHLSATAHNASKGHHLGPRPPWTQNSLIRPAPSIRIERISAIPASTTMSAPIVEVIRPQPISLAPASANLMIHWPRSVAKISVRSPAVEVSVMVWV
jgi:hypothetical protein